MARLVLGWISQKGASTVGNVPQENQWHVKLIMDDELKTEEFHQVEPSKT
jgi:hypothetical protein